MSGDEVIEHIRNIKCTKEQRNALLDAWNTGKSDVFAKTLIEMLDDIINTKRLGLEVLRNKYSNRMIYHKAQVSLYERLRNDVERMLKEL